jgi:hypothetical protein
MADRKDINPRRPIPADGYDMLRENLAANFLPDPEQFPEPQGFPTVSFPNPDNRASANRGTHTSRKDDVTQDVSIGLQDHDEAIMYYFNNVIKPSVIVNGDRTPVPIMYGSPERWKGVQKMDILETKKANYKPLLLCLKEIVLKNVET